MADDVKPLRIGETGLFKETSYEDNLKIAEIVGQVLISLDRLNFSSELPLTSRQGWLVNNSGLLLVVG